MFEPENSGYSIQTDFFEGPLDLLLHLIRKNKLNILDVKLAEITSEYLQHLEKSAGINPSRESEFLMTAATLIYIKSRTLLPRPEVLGEEESPEKKLLSTLIEYDKIQRISRLLQEMEHTEIVLWRREEMIENFASHEYDLKEVSAFQLAELFLHIVRKKEHADFLVLNSKNYSIEAKQNEILGLLAEHGYLDFNAYVAGLDSVEEIVVSFFTLLEMVKRHSLVALQKVLFGTIAVWPYSAEQTAH
jgi:segregation and condensation protein A